MKPDDQNGDPGGENLSRLSALMTKLREKGHLPALDANITDICHLTQTPETSTVDLASVILRDCALTSSAIATANSALYHPSEPIKTVSTAILVIGFETVRDISLGLGILKQISQCAKDRNLYRLFTCSYFSGMLAMALGQKSGHRYPEELRVAGVLAGLPRLLLANAFPEQYATMQQRMLRDRQPLTTACLEVFGVGYDQLTQEVVRYWNIPANVAKCLKGDAKNDPVLAAVQRGNRIADMMFGNVTGGEAALNSMQNELRQSFKDDEFHLADFIAQSAGADPNVARFFRLNPKDVEMMVRIAEWGKVNPAEVAAMLTFGAAAEVLEPKVKEDPALVVGQYLTDLTLHIRRGADINRILLIGMEGIYRCTQPAGVIVSFLDRSKTHLEGRFCMGFSIPFGVEEYRVSLKDKQSPVVRCWESKEVVRVPAGAGLLRAISRSLDPDSVLLAPILAWGSPIGQCFVGRQGGAAFTEQEASWLEAFTSHLGMAFERRKPAA